MEQITPPTLKIGNVYGSNSEEFRQVMDQAGPDAHPLDVAWELRQLALAAGENLYSEDLPDEPVRRVVGRPGPR